MRLFHRVLGPHRTSCFFASSTSFGAASFAAATWFSNVSGFPRFSSAFPPSATTSRCQRDPSASRVSLR